MLVANCNLARCVIQATRLERRSSNLTCNPKHLHNRYGELTIVGKRSAQLHCPKTEIGPVSTTRFCHSPGARRALLSRVTNRSIDALVLQPFGRQLSDRQRFAQNVWVLDTEI